MEREYDPVTCICAKELREVGINVPEEIPDCAWVPRTSLNLKLGDVSQDPSDPTVISVLTEMNFIEPFRWVEAKITMEK